NQLERGEAVEWSSREQAVTARRYVRLNAISLEEKPLPEVPADAAHMAMLEGVREMGIDVLPWTRDARDLQARMEFVRRREGEDGWWPGPAVADAAPTATMDPGLDPWLDGMTRRDHLARLSMTEILRSLLPWDRRQQLEGLAPTHLQVPSGSNIRIDYLDAS